MNRIILNDKPIQTSKEDLLGYNVFVQNIVDVLNIIPEKESFNFALCGKWGSGKTSIINLVNNQIIKEHSFNVISFNPWHITTKENLIFEYFELLRKALYKETSDITLSRAIRRYSTILINSFGNDSLLRKIIGLSFKILTLGFFDDKKTISEQKDFLINYLTTQYNGKPLLVFIDDLDRLSNNEVCEVLKLIREIGNFPHIVYFVAFDKEQINKAIDIILQPVSANDYLKKFFQLEWNVPMIEISVLKEFLLQKIQNHKLNNESPQFNEKYYSELFDKCISPFVNNLRDIILLFNSFYQKYTLLNNWLNPIDLLVITSFELFFPELYLFIARNKNTLLYGKGLPGYNPLENFMLQQTIVPTEKELNSYLNDKLLRMFSDEQKSIILQVLYVLFPAFSRACGKTISFNENNSESERRICSSMCFNSYFTQKKDFTSSIEMGTLYKFVHYYTDEEMYEFFKKYKDNPKILSNIFDELFQELATENDKSRLYLIFKNLFIAGNYNFEEKQNINYEYKDLQKKTFEIINQIFRKFSKDENGKLFKQLLAENIFLDIYVFLTYYMNMQFFYYQQRQEPESENLLFSYEDFDSINKSILDLLAANSDNIKLFDNFHQNNVLQFYLRNDNETINDKFNQQLLKTEALIDLCFLAYPDIYMDKYESLSDLFAKQYPFIKSIQNRESEVAEFINDGLYQKYSEDDLIKLSIIAEKLHLVEYLRSEKNIKNWELLEECRK